MVSGDINSGEEVHYVMSCPYKEDAKKLKSLEEYYVNLSGLEQYKQWQKDRQIVKRLEERIKNESDHCTFCDSKLQFQKILEGEK